MIKTLNFDCLFFTGQKPCKYHKEYNIVCSDCKFYKKIDKRILIIKLGAAGDILRTTAILPALKLKYKNTAIYWLTQTNYLTLLENCDLLDFVFDYSEDNIRLLANIKFDICICLDAEPISAILTNIIPIKKIYGYIWDKKFAVIKPAEKKSQYLYNLGIDDNLKKIIV